MWSYSGRRWCRGSLMVTIQSTTGSLMLTGAGIYIHAQQEKNLLLRTDRGRFRTNSVCTLRPVLPDLPCLLVSAPLSSFLLASCLLLAVARIRRPSLLPSHLWRLRSVRFHLLPSAAILRRFFLSLHPTVISRIPLLFTRRPARPPCRPPTLVGFPSHRTG